MIKYSTRNKLLSSSLKAKKRSEMNFGTFANKNALQRKILQTSLVLDDHRKDDSSQGEKLFKIALDQADSTGSGSK